MDIKLFLTEKEQEEVLLGITTGVMFEKDDFEKALKNGCTLTAKVVYFASLRGKKWLKSCSVSRHFTSKAVNLCHELYGDNDLDDFFTICLKNNCIMAYHIYPDETIEYIEDHESENLETINEFRAWQKEFD